MVSYKAVIFPMRIPCGKTFFIVSRQRSSVKVRVKYTGQIVERNGRYGVSRVSQAHLLCKCFQTGPELRTSLAKLCAFGT